MLEPHHQNHLTEQQIARFCSRMLTVEMQDNFKPIDYYVKRKELEATLFSVYGTKNHDGLFVLPAPPKPTRIQRALAWIKRLFK